jgi:ribose-phosphate pyrophosphokinase
MALDLFALEATREFGQRVAAELGLTLGDHEEREFEDGEHKARPLANVRGHDVYVIHSLYGDDRFTVNDKLIRLLFFLGALKDAGAARTTAVVPYLAYARKDRKTKLQDPVSTRYLACLFEAVGVDGILTIDVHNLAAYQNAFRIDAAHLEARVLFVERFAALDAELVAASPDVGGTKRAEAFRADLERRLGRRVTSAFMDKQRSRGVVSGEALVGDVAGRTVLLVDDLISSGTTLARCAQACLERGAEAVYAVATHGAFVADANDKLSSPAVERIVVTDTIPPVRVQHPELQNKLEVVPTAPLFAAAIRCMHEGGALEELLLLPDAPRAPDS